MMTSRTFQNDKNEKAIGRDGGSQPPHAPLATDKEYPP
jgi:hypothetical protein